MKAKLFVFLTVIGCSLAWNGCKNDDDDFSPEKSIQREFQTRYPNAKDVSWEEEKGYSVAKFRQGNEYSEAWFTETTLWNMTNTDIRFPSLPQDVQDSYNGSQYADWRIDGVTRLERMDTKMLYIIEVENELGETDLLYSASGILINAIPHQDIEFYLPANIPKKVKDFIAAIYPAAEIMQYSRFGYTYVTDVIDGILPMHVVFDRNSDWLYTAWEEYYLNLPEQVRRAVETDYAGYRTLSALHREAPAGTTYTLTLKKGQQTIQVVFDPDGNIVDENNPAV